MRVILTEQAPLPSGHYSQAVTHEGLVYVSGQLPIEPGIGVHLGDAPIEAQATRALHNLAAILRAAGSDIDHVLKVTVYIADIALWARVNAVYETFFGAHRPARAVVPTGPLHFGLQVEIEAVAAIKRPADARSEAAKGIAAALRGEKVTLERTWLPFRFEPVGITGSRFEP